MEKVNLLWKKFVSTARVESGFIYFFLEKDDKMWMKNRWYQRREWWIITTLHPRNKQSNVISQLLLFTELNSTLIFQNHVVFLESLIISSSWLRQYINGSYERTRSFLRTVLEELLSWLSISFVIFLEKLIIKSSFEHHKGLNGSISSFIISPFVSTNYELIRQFSKLPECVFAVSIVIYFSLIAQRSITLKLNFLVSFRAPCQNQ